MLEAELDFPSEIDGLMTSPPEDDAATRQAFGAELERLLDLPQGAAADLDLVRCRRDSLRRDAQALLDEAEVYEAKRDAVLESMRKKTAAIRTLTAAGESEGVDALRAAVKAEYAIGAELDQRAGELMDRHFELMAKESEVSGYYAVLRRLANQ